MVMKPDTCTSCIHCRVSHVKCLGWTNVDEDGVPDVACDKCARSSQECRFRKRMKPGPAVARGQKRTAAVHTTPDEAVEPRVKRPAKRTSTRPSTPVESSTRSPTPVDIESPTVDIESPTTPPVELPIFSIESLTTAIIAAMPLPLSYEYELRLLNPLGAIPIEPTIRFEPAPGATMTPEQMMQLVDSWLAD